VTSKVYEQREREKEILLDIKQDWKSNIASSMWRSPIRKIDKFINTISLSYSFGILADAICRHAVCCCIERVNTVAMYYAVMTWNNLLSLQLWHKLPAMWYCAVLHACFSSATQSIATKKITLRSRSLNRDQFGSLCFVRSLLLDSDHLRETDGISYRTSILAF